MSTKKGKDENLSSLNFLRLQAITVAGFTKINASFQPDQNFEIQARNIRSGALILGFYFFSGISVN